VSFPHFFVVETTNEEPIKFSIFTIKQFIRVVALIEVDSKIMATRAMAMTTWLNTKIIVSPHWSFNSSRGVLRCCLSETDVNVVMDALRPQGVIALEHVQAKRDGKPNLTSYFISTISTSCPPKFIKIAYMCILVEPFSMLYQKCRPGNRLVKTLSCVRTMRRRRLSGNWLSCQPSLC